MRKAFQRRCNWKDPAGSWPWRTRRAELATSHAKAFQTRRWKTHHLRKYFIFQIRKPMAMPALPLRSRWKQYSGRSWMLRQYDKIFLIRPRLYVNHQYSQGNPSTIYRCSSTNQSIPRTKAMGSNFLLESWYVKGARDHTYNNESHEVVETDHHRIILDYTWNLM